VTVAAHAQSSAPRSRARRRLRWPVGRIGLDRRLAAGACPRSHFTAAVPVRRQAVLDARTELLLLAAALRGAPDPEPRGIAMVSLLLSDGAGPIFAEHPPNALRDAVQEATRRVEAV
jgi:hypothetical protein